eukprot:scpid28026/ scgid13842/ Structural maintenance of chromosomes protein 6
MASKDTDRKAKKRKRDSLDEEEDEVLAPSKRTSRMLASEVDDDTEMDISEMSQVQADPHLCASVARPAECGIIEKISLKNFMCHSNLDVVLGPNATILNGKNGSGKSAILVAIVVGLGGAASATKRGSALKNFIKEGCNSANITIKIKNHGDDAYLSEEYGDSIIVERRIGMDGTGGYKIKGSNEKAISNTKDDLIRILDHFNIQVDNPVCVLQQDMSRSFMHSTSPKDKYKFFMQATQLDLMCRNYREILEYKDDLAQQMKMKKASMPSLERDVMIKEQRFKDLERLDKLEQKKASLECDIAWAQVKDLESILEELRTGLQHQQKRLPGYKKKMADCDVAIKNAEQNRAALQASFKEIGREIEAATTANATKAQELRSQKLVLREAQSKIQQVKGKIRTTEGDRDQVKAHIAELRQLAMVDREAESRERNAKLERLRQELREAEDRLRTTNDFRHQLEQALRTHQEKRYHMKGDISEAQNQVDQHKRRLEQLRSSKQNRVQVFGRGYADLVHRIDAAHRQRQFRKKPIGPLGLHLNLHDEKWALAVEACVSRGILSGFLVDNGEDKRVVQQLIRDARMERPPTIIITRFLDSRHDVTRNKAHTNHPTVMDVLDIDNPVVFNALVDQRNVESHVLVHDAQEARTFIWSRPPPQRCYSVYTGAGDVAYPDKRYISNRARNVMCLQQNVDGEIAHVENELRQCSTMLTKLSQERDELEQHINDANRELRSSRGKLSRDQDKQNRLQADIAELASVEEEESRPLDIATLEEDIRTMDLRLDELHTDLQEHEEQVAHILPLLREQQERQHEVTLQHDEIGRRGKALKDEIGEVERDLVKTRQHKDHYSNSFAQKQKEIEDLQRRIQTQEKLIADTEGKVQAAYPERSTSRRSVKHLESELRQMDKALREKDKSQGNREEITAEYHEVSQRFTKLRQELKILDQLGQKLGDAMIKRQAAFKQIRDKLETRLKVYFFMFMSRRGYQGKFEFNHESETLDMHVKVVDDAKLTKDTKTLSGGERSFSMVAFILALWDVMETPFRCLDEFDVFMDLVNRRIAMDMLLSAASTNRKRQFILLTPQDLSNWSNKDHVRILRMKDPVRNQPTLDAHLVQQNA